MGHGVCSVILGVLLLLVYAPGASAAPDPAAPAAASGDPISVGVLHSTTGVMAFSEAPLVDAVKLAVDEVNRDGGVLGRRVKVVTLDGASEDRVFATRADELLRVHGVAAIFGCWTSSSRQAVRTVVEREDGLLYYPVQYEGERPSANIFYLGAAPNQQLIPAVQWAVAKFRRDGQPLRIYLVGSDYSFPREAHRLIRALCPPSTAVVVGEDLVPLTETRFDRIAEQVRDLKPDVVFNTLNGRSNFGFFADLVRAGIDASDVPVISFSIGEPEIRRAGTEGTVGHYAAWNYLAAMQTPAAARFQDRWRRHQVESQGVGVDVPTSDPIEASYLSVHLWAEAVRRAGRFDAASVRESSKGLIVDAPEGLVRLDPENQHLWKSIRIGQVGPHGDLLPVMDSAYPVRPVPLPAPGPALLGSSLWLPAAPTSITEARQMLGSSSTPSRIAALRYFADVGRAEPALESEIASRLMDDDWSVRAEAVRAMLRLGSTAQATLARQLERGSAEDRLLVLCLTSEYLSRAPGRDAAAVTRAAAALLRDDDPLVGFHAIRLLNQVGRAQGVANADVWPHLARLDVRHRAQAVRLLRYVDRPTTDDVDELMKAVRMDRSPLARPVAEAAADTVAALAHAWSDAPTAEQLDELGRATGLLATVLPGSAVVREAQSRVASLAPVNPWHVRLWSWIRSSTWRIGATLVLAGVAVWCALLALLYLASPIKLIAADSVFDAWQSGLAKLTDGKVVIPLNLLGPHWLKHTDRVLDDWVDRHWSNARTRYVERLPETAPERYFPLPVLVDERVVEKPNHEVFAALAGTTPFTLSIRGDGGSGKTSLAIQIGRWALDRKLWRHAAIPVLLLRRDAVEKQLTTPAEVDEAVVSALTATAGLETSPPLDFVRALLRRKRILLIVDDVGKLMPDGGYVLGDTKIEANALVVTSRARPVLGSRVVKEVRAERIKDPDVLRRFLDQCVAVNAETAGDVTLRENLVAEESDRLRQMNTAMPALFVRLYAETLVETSRHGRLPLTDLAGIAGIVERYVVSVIDTSVLDGARADDALRAVHLLAWACVRGQFRAEPVTEDEAVGLLHDCGGRPMLDDLLRHVRVVEVGGALRDRVMFGLDPIAEYLAAVAVYRAHVPPGALEDLRGRLVDRAKSAGDRTLEPFLVALAELLREPRLADPRLATVRQLLQAAARPRPGARKRQLPIGILHSLQGTMSISEYSLVRAARLAIDEVNEAGLIPDHEIVHEVCDGESHDEVFAAKARQLIVERGVVSIFGCWTSASRQRVLPTIAEYRNLLWYPVQYEGYESSPYVIYTGAAPNQQIIPALRWFGHNGKKRRLRVMMVGTNYVFPIRANAIARRLLEAEDLGEVVGEPLYLAFGEMDVRDFADRVRRERPTLVLNTINGESNVALFQQLADAGVRADASPVLSMSIAEEEIARIGPALVKGHYAAWNYFQSLDTPENGRFRQALTRRYGRGCVSSDPVAMAYAQIHLFALACRKATEAGRPLTPEAIAECARGLEFAAPCGRVRIDPDNQHLWKTFMLGRSDGTGQFAIVDRSSEWIRPEPYPYPVSDLRE